MRGQGQKKKEEFTLTLQKQENGLYCLVELAERESKMELAQPNKRMQRQKKKESMAGLQYQMQTQAPTIAIEETTSTHIMPKRRPEAGEPQIIEKQISQNDGDLKMDEDAEEKLLMEQINKDKEIEKQYQKAAFIIPSCAQWFDFNSIHEIEMQTLPEFFCEKFSHKNPETYLNYRNYIIKMYRENPNAYLSATECRKKLPGDICSIIRLHAFLEHWGLINFNVEPYLRPAKIQLGESGNMSSHVIDAAAKGYINVAEAKRIQQVFDKKGNDSNGPQSNLFIIAAQKIKAICTSYAPVCNFCGNVCNNKHWYQKILSKSAFARDGEHALKHFKEQNSIHQTLKNLTSTYLICKECFDLGNYPKILQEGDFERASLQSMLAIADHEKPSTVDDEDDSEWTEEEIIQLVDSIAEHQNDWEAITQIFDNKSPEQCVMKFLQLPLTENMMSKIHMQSEKTNSNQNLSKQSCPSVLMDTSNPLFSQVAIFARCLEERENQIQEKLQQQQQQALENAEGLNTSSLKRSGVLGRQGLESQALPVIEKRTTRRMRQQMRQEKPASDTAENAPKKEQINEDKLYLIEPSSRTEPAIPDKVLDQIATKAIGRSKRLAKAARKDCEAELNKIIFEQLQKVEMKFEYIRKIWGLFQLEKNDIQMQREECLAERVALSALKSGNYKQNQNLEKHLWQNQFASAKNLLEEVEN